MLALVAGHSYYGREALLGMFRHASTRTRWDMHYESILAVGNIARALRQWKADGVFAQIVDRREWRMVVGSGVPAVNVSGCFMEGVANVCPDNEAVGRLAAQHLLRTGLRTLAYCGVSSEPYSVDRARGFEQAAVAAKCRAHMFDLHATGRNWDWHRDHGWIVTWLRRLSKPAGVMACNDFVGRYAMWACRSSGVQVPDELAIIGVDNDPVEGGLCGVPLSSVSLPARAIGEQAAALLDRMLHDRRLRAHPPTIRIPPAGIVTRQSTDVYATADPLLVAILRHIRENLAEPMPMAELAHRFGLSRRSMELRFNKAFGVAPGAELLHARLAHAQSLLAQTDVKITALHTYCGFARHSYFSRVFHSKTGLSPVAYRRQFRTQGDGMASHVPWFHQESTGVRPE